MFQQRAGEVPLCIPGARGYKVHFSDCMVWRLFEILTVEDTNGHSIIVGRRSCFAHTGSIFYGGGSKGQSSSIQVLVQGIGPEFSNNSHSV